MHCTLHLACAVEADTDVPCTCDDKLLRRANTVDTGFAPPVAERSEACSWGQT